MCTNIAFDTLIVKCDYKNVLTCSNFVARRNHSEIVQSNKTGFCTHKHRWDRGDSCVQCYQGHDLMQKK